MISLCLTFSGTAKLFSRSIALFTFLLQSIQSVQSLSRVRLFVILRITARQASLSITNSWSLLKLMSIELVMPSNHLILCHPLLLLPPIPPSIRVLSNESALCMRWPNYWSFSFSISPPMNTQDSSPLGWTGWISLQSKGLSSLLQHHSSYLQCIKFPISPHHHQTCYCL